jgi:hypothetical protein
MSKLSTAIKLLKENRGEFCASVIQNLGFLFPDKLYLTLLFRCKMGYWIDWKNPKTFSEKLQWLKLYNRKPEYTTMVDKYAVKEYVAKLIGEEYIIPTLGVWDSPEEINWDELPNQFVLKTTHGGGNTGVVICKDKANFDKKAAVKKLSRSLKSCIYQSYREWPYKNVKRRIIAEQYMEDAEGVLNDYKFFCFEWKVEAMFVATERQNEYEDTKFDFFDKQYSHLPFCQGHQNANEIPQKPNRFEKMIQLSELLTLSIPQIRVDWYEIGNRIYFGELTFFHYGGIVPFEPQEWDYKFGEFISLPKIDNK